ncbi:MAG: 4Fe-4S binding protein [Desulfosoma sp.]
MKVMRKVIEIDQERCDGCGQCVVACAEGAIEIIDGKAALVSDVYCDGLGACLGECPQRALRLVEREAEDFDPEAVERYLESKHSAKTEEPRVPQGVHQCPSQQIHTLQSPMGRGQISVPTASALQHWPVQIRLIPPNAPFLQDADLLVAADCTAVAVPDFHQRFLNGRAVMIGCPKFDDILEYVDRFAKIFSRNTIRHVTVLSMEVPCCSALLSVVRKGLEKAEKEVPLTEIVLGIRGNVLETRNHLPKSGIETTQKQA